MDQLFAIKAWRWVFVIALVVVGCSTTQEHNPGGSGVAASTSPLQGDVRSDGSLIVTVPDGGLSVSLIEPEGYPVKQATLTIPAGATITFPPGAIPQIRITSSKDKSTPGSATPTYEIEPHGTTLSTKATLTITPNEGLDVTKLTCQHSYTGQFIISSSYQATLAGDQVTCTLSHFSEIVLMPQAGSSYISGSQALTGSPSRLEGETLIAQVHNQPSDDGPPDLIWYIRNMDTRTHTVAISEALSDARVTIQTEIDGQLLPQGTADDDLQLYSVLCFKNSDTSGLIALPANQEATGLYPPDLVFSNLPDHVTPSTPSDVSAIMGSRDYVCAWLPADGIYTEQCGSEYLYKDQICCNRQIGNQATQSCVDGQLTWKSPFDLEMNPVPWASCAAAANSQEGCYGQQLQQPSPPQVPGAGQGNGDSYVYYQTGSDPTLPSSYYLVSSSSTGGGQNIPCTTSVTVADVCGSCPIWPNAGQCLGYWTFECYSGYVACTDYSCSEVSSSIGVQYFGQVNVCSPQ